MNDLADEAIDKVNLADSKARPLANRSATRREIKNLAALSAASALAISALHSHSLVIATAAGLIFNWVYSYRPLNISHRGLLAPLLLPIAYVVIPFSVGSLTVNNPLVGGRTALLVGMYVCFIGRIILKDFRDVKGDSRYGKKTFLLRYGRTQTCLTSAVFWITGAMILAFTNPILALAFGFYLPLVLIGLLRLYKANNFSDEQLVIWAIARIGAAIALSIFIAYQLSGSPLYRQLGYLLAAAVPFVGLYWQVLGDKIRHKAAWPKLTYRNFEFAPKNLVMPPQDSLW